jgi:hypothetical protein
VSAALAIRDGASAAEGPRLDALFGGSIIGRRDATCRMEAKPGRRLPLRRGVRRGACPRVTRWTEFEPPAASHGVPGRRTCGADRRRTETVLVTEGREVAATRHRRKHPGRVLRRLPVCPQPLARRASSLHDACPESLGADLRSWPTEFRRIRGRRIRGRPTPGRFSQRVLSPSPGSDERRAGYSVSAAGARRLDGDQNSIRLKAP